jgi:lipoprotein-anchoring transpeptidase ErfK/SrfK
VPRWFRLATVGLTIMIAACFVAGAGAMVYPIAYSDRIYPGVSVHDVGVGRLTVEEATVVLIESLPDPSLQGIGLRAGEHFWRLSWADTGQAYDYAGTAIAAYQVARESRWYEQILPAWRVRLQGHSVEPFITPADPERVRAALERAATLISVPPTDAQLRIGPAGAVPAPGQPGEALDVEASTARVLQALANGAPEVELVLTAVPPRLSEPEPALTLARSLLAQPFSLVSDDPLTGYHAEFQAPPERVATWLRAVPEYAPQGARMVLEAEEAAVRAWLLEVAPQLEPERLLDVAHTVTRTVAALTAGEHQTEGRIRHPQGTHVVEPGDTFFDIAYRYGFPQWRLEEANPDVDPEALAIGMELVIPSMDVLFPEPLVTGKRIEISLPEQRLRAYEDGQLVYDFACSSGISTTPTIAGQFQVLFKEPSAYASRWNLEMPYFMAVYQEGPEFFNGMHELPITASGRRLWAGVLGWPASYGCIILNVGDAEALYDWAPVGTLVRITGVAPGTPVYEEQDAE